MPDPLIVAAVQFEMIEADKAANLATMARFIDEAAARKANVISFPELCTTGYHFLTGSSPDRLKELAEPIPGGETVNFFAAKARKTGVSVLFGMLERGQGETMYNTYVVVTPEGYLFKHRKLHAFENSAILQGDRMETFDLMGWKCGILICYDNNLPENTRVLMVKGAEIIFAPHQTGAFDIQKAGMGRIPLELWRNRHHNPVPMRKPSSGPRGAGHWLLKWLPGRSYDNNVFTVFANGVGIDGPEVRVGCSMIIDPEGVILTETTEMGDAMVLASLSKSARVDSLAGSHLVARRPSLYGPICDPIQEVDTRLVRNRISGEKIR